jgi:uncharacterized membrane protein
MASRVVRERLECRNIDKAGEAVEAVLEPPERRMPSICSPLICSSSRIRRRVSLSDIIAPPVEPVLTTPAPALPAAARQRADVSFWITSGIVFVVLLVPKLFQHAAAHTGDLDTGNYSNLAWAIFHGEGFRGSVLGRHHLGEHFSPIMALVGLIYLVWSSAYVLMILQASAVWLAMLLVLRFTDRQLRGAGFDDNGDNAGAKRVRFWACALLLVLMLTCPPLIATWATQFQPIELGMPLVVSAIVLMHAKRDGWLAVMTLLLLATRESAPLAVVGLAIYAALALRRWKLAIVLLVTAAAWAGVTMGVIMPYFRAGRHWAHERYFDPNAMWEMKGRYLLTMVFALGPLPLLGRSALSATAAALPGMLLNVAVDRETQLTFVGHYDAQTAPFLMIAAAHGVVWLAAFARAAPARRRIAAMVAVASLALAWGLFALAEVRTPMQMWVRWFPTRERLALVQESKDVVEKFADAPAMAAWARIGPHVCHRPNYMGLRGGDTSEQWVHWASERLAPGTVILVPTRAYTADRAAARDQLPASGHAQLVHRGEYVEAWRWPTDAPPPGTPEAEQYVRAGLDLPRR